MTISLNYYSNIPSPEKLRGKAQTSLQGFIPEINGHIHSPHSFSAFWNIEQAFQMAKQENISVLGINDFNTTDGYEEFAKLAGDYHIFPLFNIEFMALQSEEQRARIRINDPVNPGRTYLSGKGLRFPPTFSEKSRLKLEELQMESNRQTFQMVARLNEYLTSVHAGLEFDPEEIRQRLAKRMLRERHIAMAIRIALFEKWDSEREREEIMTLLFGGKKPVSPSRNLAAIENEIRNNLLKTGGPAYVPEDEKAFLSLREVTELIIDAGGIPCYPVLLDDPKGNFTEFENDWEKMADQLATKSIFMIELIPGRNSFTVLKEFVAFFDSKGFSITFGTEHNTPQLDPLTVSCRGKVPPDQMMKAVSFKGAAIIAAHQFLTANGEEGFPVHRFPTAEELHELAILGEKVIFEFTKK
jgi:hypothetical protein